MNPRWPVYVVSRGRYEVRLTSRALDRMGVPHYLVVEEHEYDLYADGNYPTATLLVLPRRYIDEYDYCDDYGLSEAPGPGPARNFAWDHSTAAGARWHWTMDDNIRLFARLNRNLKTTVGDGTILAAMEAFVDRYENVAMAGPNYFMFAARRRRIPPFVPNTRIYSCQLTRNDVPYRWRSRWNDDTDLSLRMLKDGWCTILFNAFLAHKMRTQTVRGGCTDTIYRRGTLEKSEVLVRLHPDVVRLTWRFKRAHHYVDYSRFRGNRLVRRPDVDVPSGTDEFGMTYQRIVDGEWTTADPVDPR